MQDEIGKAIACFKPRDEEQQAPNNPKEFVGEYGQLCMERNIRSGQLYRREVAAFLLDATGFHNVPATACVEIREKEILKKSFFYKDRSKDNFAKNKKGSLQEFVHALYENVADRTFNMYSAREVHKIGILDIRILNCDRNDENLLVKSDCDNRLKLIPIDHGLCLSDDIEIGWCDWVWYKWPQAQKPFDPYTKKFIKNINIDEDCERLRSQLPMSEKVLDNLRISTLLLKIATSHGFTLYDIARIMLREDLEKPSEIEILCSTAKRLAYKRTKQIESSNQKEDEKVEPLLFLPQQIRK
eukprot:UN33291